MWSPADDMDSSMSNNESSPPSSRATRSSNITAAGHTNTSQPSSNPLTAGLPSGLTRNHSSGLAPSPNVFTRSLSFALNSDWPPPVVDSEGLIRGFSEWSMSSLDGPADEQDPNGQLEAMADLKEMLEQNQKALQTAETVKTEQGKTVPSNTQGPAPAWASRGSVSGSSSGEVFVMMMHWDHFFALLTHIIWMMMDDNRAFVMPTRPHGAKSKYYHLYTLGMPVKHQEAHSNPPFPCFCLPSIMTVSSHSSPMGHPGGFQLVQ